MFVNEPPASDAREALYAQELEADGSVANNTRLWAWRPDILLSFTELRAELRKTSSLTDRDWAVLVVSTASTMGDSCCALAWERGSPS